MTDVFDEKKRSDIMSRIRSTNTKPELTVRKLLFASGFRYRLYDKKLPGKPDIVLPRWRTVVLVHGCFWHSHQGCSRDTTPTQNHEFWIQKLNRNRARDLEVRRQLHELGWRVLVVWECACRKSLLEHLQGRMERFIKFGAEEYVELGGLDLSASTDSEAGSGRVENQSS